jgi:S-adenosylmethionine decarboxylase
MTSRLARHVLIEFHGCEASAIADGDSLMSGLLDAVRRSGATYVNHLYHAFAPHGTSGIVLIAESHVAFHTWPEHGYMAMDIFTCSETMDWELIRASMEGTLRANRVGCRVVDRGEGLDPEKIPGLRLIPFRRR